MLRRPVVFMAGLYRGGRRYELRFVAARRLQRRAPARRRATRDAAIQAAMQRYVATLEALCREAPYNWFNFFDFWADADAPTRTPMPRLKPAPPRWRPHRARSALAGARRCSRRAHARAGRSTSPR